MSITRWSSARTCPGRGLVALALSLSPLKDNNDMTQGVTLVMDDVTHLHEHESTISAMKRILPEGMVDQINEIANIEMGGVRREVTCIFADVRPWTTLPDVTASEKLQHPEPVPSRSPPPASTNAPASSTNTWATK